MSTPWERGESRPPHIVQREIDEALAEAVGAIAEREGWRLRAEDAEDRIERAVAKVKSARAGEEDQYWLTVMDDLEEILKGSDEDGEGR